MMALDDRDQQLISLLRHDARASVVDLARRLGTSRATVQNRMNRLERDGVILGYTLVLKPEADTRSVRALMSLATQTKQEPGVIAALRGFPDVVAIHHTTGRWDLIAELRCATLAVFNDVVGRIRLVDGVKDTESNLLLDSYDRRDASEP
ncbi:MAG: Lrp/AsnC family transcriptional regulator [Pseudomonadota bacterium]